MPETTTPEAATQEAAKPTVPTLDLPLQYEYDGKTYGPGEAVLVEDPIAFAQLRRAALSDTLRIRLAEEARQRAEKAKAQAEQAKADQENAQADKDAQGKTDQDKDAESNAAPVTPPTPAPETDKAPDGDTTPDPLSTKE